MTVLLLGLVATALATAGWFAVLDRHAPLRVADIALGAMLGPWIAALIAMAVFTLRPGAGATVLAGWLLAYVFAGLFLGGAALRRSSVPPLPPLTVASAAWLAPVAVVLWQSWMSLRLPAIANDPLEYATLGRLFMERTALDWYPPATADPQTGFWMPTSHPPFYPIMIALTFIAQGHADTLDSARLLAPLAAAGGAFAVALAVRAIGARRAAPWFAVAYLLAPGMLGQITSHHIDPVRIQPLAVALALGLRHRQAALWATGMALGFAATAHSLGLPVAGLLLTAWTVESLRGARSAVSVRRAVIVGAALAAPFYGANIWRYGRPIKDSNPVWAMPELRFEEFFTLLRDFDDPLRAWSHGVFRVLTEPAYYGWLAWPAVAALLFWLLGRKPRALSAVFVPVLGWFVFSAAAVLAGSIEPVKNPRYVLSIWPMLVVAAAALGPLLLATTQSRRIAAIGTTVAVVAALLPVEGGQRLKQLHTAALAAVTDEREAAMQSSWRVRETVEAVATLSAQSRVFVFRRAELAFYTRLPMVFHLDDRLVPVYRERDVADMAAALRDLGVTHILVPPDPQPTLTRTLLGDLLADPERVQLLWLSGRHRLFELREQAGPPATLVGRLCCGMLRRSVAGSDRPAFETEVVDAGPVQLTAGTRRVHLQTGDGVWSRPLPTGPGIEVLGAGVYVIHWTAGGHGDTGVDLVRFEGTRRTIEPLWREVLLDDPPGPRAALFTVTSPTEQQRIVWWVEPGGTAVVAPGELLASGRL